MKIRLGDVKGILPKYKTHSDGTHRADDEAIGFAIALDEISNRSFTLNRDELAHSIFKFDYPEQEWTSFKIKWNDYYELADAIISALPEIVEYVPEGK